MLREICCEVIAERLFVIVCVWFFMLEVDCAGSSLLGSGMFYEFVAQVELI